MTSSYILAESELIDFAKAIRGATDVDDALNKAREAGYSTDDINRLFGAAMDREFKRKLNLARSH
jgi:hypothetical protein